MKRKMKRYKEQPWHLVKHHQQNDEYFRFYRKISKPNRHLSKRKIKIGDKVGETLVLVKEAYPYFRHQGKERMRQGIFRCQLHPDSLFLMTFEKARMSHQAIGGHCPCDLMEVEWENSYFQNTFTGKLEDYSYSRERQAHLRFLKYNDPSWWRVDGGDLYINGKFFYRITHPRAMKFCLETADYFYNRKMYLGRSYSSKYIMKAGFILRLMEIIDDLDSSREELWDFELYDWKLVTLNYDYWDKFLEDWG